MNSTLVRRARVEDVTAICAIQNACGLSRWPRSAYEAEVDRKGSIMLVALTAAGEVGGFITGRLKPGEHEADTHAEIYNLGVEPTERLRGVGSALLEEYIGISRSAGVSQIFLEVRKSNGGAIRFYEAHSFETRGTRPRFYSDPAEDAITMSLNLANRA